MWLTILCVTTCSHCCKMAKHNIVIRPQLYKLIMYDCFPLANGAITTVQSRSIPFTTNPISFQLYGDSTGGPPTTNYWSSYWSRNGINITNNSTFSTSISFSGSHNKAGHRTANYRSTLTVTGRQPGVYQYHASNRRTTGVRTAQVLVDGNYQYTL